MGTSSSHRSPSTPEWERVRELYRTPDAAPSQIASRIVSALDSGTRQALAGPGVACCLGTLLEASQASLEGRLEALLQTALPAHGPALLPLAQSLRQQAEQQIVRDGLASRFTDLALNALGTATFEAGAGGAVEVLTVPVNQVVTNLGRYAGEQRLGELAVCYLSHDFDHLFRYFVTRDLSDFIGHEALPSVAHGSRLRDAVTRHCRTIISQMEASIWENELAAALQAPAAASREQLAQSLEAMTDTGLRLIAAGGM
jgi:hypothetical protein